MTAKNAQVNCCTERERRITAADLPLHCPTDDMTLWNGHPRVFLPIEDSGGEILCPYCGTKYILVSSQVSSG